MSSFAGRLLLVSTLLIAITAPVRAQTWVFQRSYYSHQPARPVQVGPRSYNGPFYTREQGAYVRAGQRRVYNTITIPGGGTDQLIVVESWVQSGAQF